MRRCRWFVLMALWSVILTMPVVTLATNDVIQQFDNGSVNWSTGKVTAVGVGAPPPNAINAAQARAMAKRAAVIDARRNLLEITQGVQLDSMTLVRDFIVRSDVVRTSVQGIVRNAQILNTSSLSDGSVEVTMVMSVTGQFANTVLPSPPVPSGGQMIPFSPTPMPAPSTNRPKSSAPTSEILTGLVIDARGLGARPAMSPKLLDESGKEVYGSAMVNREYAVQQGMAGYSKDLGAAQTNQRVTDNPLTVKGMRTVGPGKSDIVIPNNDASKILGAAENLSFMQKCRVMIVLD